MSTPMLDVARELLTSADAKSAFEADPDGFLADRGLTGWDPAEVAEALGYVTDVLPPGTATHLPSADALLGGEADGSDALARLGALEPDDVEPEDTGAYGAGAAEEVEPDDGEGAPALAQGDLDGGADPGEPADEAGEPRAAVDEDSEETPPGEGEGEDTEDPIAGLE